ncbi:MAG: metal ABC transporter permease [Thermoflexales bacterium]
MSALLVVLLTGMLTAIACALPGSFLMLRRLAMLSDAISHAILPGIVLGYFLAKGPNFALGLLGAALVAILTVGLIELLQDVSNVASESAIGIVFPAMFALGVLTISRYYANVHLDTDAVLFGNIEFAPFESLWVGEHHLGPQSLWVTGGLALLNALFVGLFYKELQLATFDPALAATSGFSPRLLHYALMAVVAVTSVAAFTAVGSILVVAFMTVPAATAYLLTDDLRRMLVLAAGCGVASAMIGFVFALALDASVAGAMASASGLLFVTAALFSPSHGLLARARQLRRQRLEFATETLLLHLRYHETLPGEEHELEVAHLSNELRWTPRFAQRVIAHAQRSGLVQRTNGHLALTEAGRAVAEHLSARTGAGLERARA